MFVLIFGRYVLSGCLTNNLYRTVQFRKVNLDYITLQGIELLFREGLYSYGWIIIAANWVPGMVASFHILHMYRGINKLPAKTTLMYTGRLLRGDYSSVNNSN